MNLRHLPGRLLVVGTAAAAVSIAGAGGAYAFWTTSGFGAATASAGTMTVSTQPFVAGDVTATQQLVPGGSADAVLKLSNPNTFPVALISVRGTGEATASNGCGPTGVTFTDATALSTTIPAGAITVVDLPGAVSMSMDSAAECQGATFTLPVVVTVRQ
jgi:hypothetical protein